MTLISIHLSIRPSVRPSICSSVCFHFHEEFRRTWHKCSQYQEYIAPHCYDLLSYPTVSSQGPRHTKDVIKMVPVLPLFSTEHSKGKILALSQELRQENKCNG